MTQLADFSSGGESLEGVMLGLKAPAISETNLYDAVIYALDRIRPVQGGKAILLISTRVAIGIGEILRSDASVQGAAKLVSGTDWKTAEKHLGQIARASGGHYYTPVSSVADPNMQRTVRVDLVNPRTGKPLEIVNTDGRPVRPTIILRQTYTQDGASQ